MVCGCFGFLIAYRYVDMLTRRKAPSKKDFSDVINLLHLGGNVSPPPVSRRGVLGLSAAAVALVASGTAANAYATQSDKSSDTKDVHPQVVECLADVNVNRRS